MACYYLVISSTHLNNGHFRSIKGVFRGPLCKTGTTIPGYAEKGKSIANALEDLKANFYCELCDKQYHKHQEFDNHINSYDHAHKQRLKELKQREFARNVASKSWKDEKKQEKALKRLHQLAELRKQPDCVADEGPLFKAPRLKGPQEDLFANKDDRVASSRCTATCQEEAVTSSSGTAENKPDILFNREVLNDSSCCFVENQTQVQVPFPNSSSVSNRASVSFCFSKKALLKLDSSASVFNESVEEVNECRQLLHHKAKQTSVSSRHYVHVNENVTENTVLSQQDETDMSLPDNAPANAEKFKDDRSSQENTKERSEIAQSNITTEMHSPDTSSIDQLSQKVVNVTSETEQASETPAEVRCQTQSCTQETCSNKHTVADAILIEHLSHLLSQKNGKEELHLNSDEMNSAASNDPVQNRLECPEHSLGESANTNAKSKTLSFLSVLSKDGNTILQWPTELLMFTKTQPSISYACNPLYFDFKCSKKNTIRKTNEKDTRIGESNDPSKNRCEDKASGINTEKDLENETESQSLEPKKERTQLEELAGNEMDSCNSHRLATELTHKVKFNHLHDSRPQVSTHINNSQNCTLRASHHSRKRKRSSHGHAISCKRSDDSKVKENTNSKEELKRKRFLQKDQLVFKDKWFSSKKCKESKDQRGYESRLSWENSDGVEDSDSDTNSETSQKTLFSQTSSSSYSTSSGSTCRHEDILSSPPPTHEASLKGDSCLSGKHNSDSSSENDCISEIANKLKCKCKNQKHKTVISEISRHEYLEHRLCCKYARSKHRSRIKQDGLGADSLVDQSHPIQENSNENSSNVKSRMDKSSASPEGIIHLSTSPRSPHTTESSTNSNTNESTYKFHHWDLMPPSVSYRNSASEKIVQRIVVNEKKTLISELLLEGEQATMPAKEDCNTRECGKEFNKHSENSFTIQCSPKDHEKVALLTSSNNIDIHNMAHTLKDVISSNESKGSTDYKVTVATSADSCPFKDLIHINRECRTEIPVEGQPGQFIGEVQPFMQSPDPAHHNFSCALPPLRHAGGTNSPETKEEQIRLGRPHVNMKSSPAEGNIKCFYDSTMQDFRRIDNNRRFHHKPISPPLAQQPITFSPDEVDKYKLLQMQAQQHMQKQLLTKHFKALPSNGSAVFSTGQTIQPVSVQHHPSITTIHHALMQQYAVTASMHSHVNHFPLPHLNPFPQSQFSPIALSSSLTPTLFPAPAQLIGHPLAHPLHLVSATAIHPAHLTIQALPHATLIPTLFAPHSNTGMHPTLQLHPLIHPLFQGHDFHHHSGHSHPH
ncbi:zinc finger protein 804B [Mixophyes fleayi]|uniref:zinc finger protein 804B n=1 Tax=Mixophyes fleayi TaxID=3061075 RepID=UPI003F4E0296